jgi:hypothetical protein
MLGLFPRAHQGDEVVGAEHRQNPQLFAVPFGMRAILNVENAACAFLLAFREERQRSLC